jgi:hypothetical protein
MINQQLSLVIPRVFPQWVDEATIVKIFRDQQIGIISKVSIVRTSETGTSETGTSETGKTYPIYKAYLYFSVWFENIIAENFQKRIYGKTKQARVVYDDPWFWTVFKNHERVKLSNIDKRQMRLSAEIYKNKQFVQAQQDQIAYEMAEQKQKLAEQNNIIQILQDFCIKNGLEIPFWSANHPPSAEVTSLEALSAATAVACADFVLQYQDEDLDLEYSSIPYECAEAVLADAEAEAEDNFNYDFIPYQCAEAVLADAHAEAEVHAEAEAEDNFNYDFIPVNSYEEDWVTENPNICDMTDRAEHSRLCSYLGGAYLGGAYLGSHLDGGCSMEAMINLPIYM